MNKKPKSTTPPTPTITQDDSLTLLSGQRQSNESDEAVIACCDYLRLGTGRSLRLLLERYTEFHQTTPPTTSIDTLKYWSTTFEWVDRAASYDASWESLKNAERAAVMNYGLALDYERLRKLYRLAAMLEAQIYERGEAGVLHNIWMADVKAIGTGEFAERVDIERFNAPLLEQYRKVLDDIAKETGGRVQKTDVTVNTWEDKVVALLKDGKVTPEQARMELGTSLAERLFIRAGIPVTRDS